VDYTILYDQLTRDLLKNFDLFSLFAGRMIWPNGYLGPDAYGYERGWRTIFPSPSRNRWITEEQGAAVKDFVMAGGGFYSLHNNSHVSLSSKNYREVMGGAYIGPSGA